MVQVVSTICEWILMHAGCILEIEQNLPRICVERGWHTLQNRCNLLSFLFLVNIDSVSLPLKDSLKIGQISMHLLLSG
jgi:putative heme iron utilization protein